jgi:diacylglycerol kinase family enzyme
MAQGFGKVIPDDGLLDVIVASPKDTMSGLSILSSLAWSAAMSSNANNNDLACFRTNQIKVDLDETQKLVIDGEILDAKSVTITIKPRALQVVAPIPLKF